MTNTAPKPKLCFHVSGGNDPEMDMIVFARSSIEAKRDWANEHGDGDRYIAGISAKRCKGWDKYAPGPVPALEMIDDGWRFECHGCYRRIDMEAIEYGIDDEGGQITPPMQPYEPSPQRIWCSRACYDDDMAERTRETEVSVANGDRDVWNAWRAENAKAAKATESA